MSVLSVSAAMALQRILRRTGLLRSAPAMRVALAIYSAYKRWADGGMLRYLATALGPGDLAVDVGANVGTYTLRMAELVGPTGTVIAFEPDPRAADALRRRARRAIGRVLIRRVALGERHGTATLHLGAFPADSRLWSEGTSVGVTEVPVRTLDEELSDEPRAVALVKIDVQGAELAVLRGMDRTLERSPEATVVVELWPAGLRDSGATLGEITDRLGRTGRRPMLVSPDGRGHVCEPAVVDEIAHRRGYVDVVFGPALSATVPKR